MRIFRKLGHRDSRSSLGSIGSQSSVGSQVSNESVGAVESVLQDIDSLITELLEVPAFKASWRPFGLSASINATSKRTECVEALETLKLKVLMYKGSHKGGFQEHCESRYPLEMHTRLTSEYSN